MNVLFVEDNAHKRERVQIFLEEAFPGMALVHAHSFTSGCKRIQERVFDIALMDISLPTYDKGASESGGRFRTFGGRELARKMVRRGLPTKIIFISQYDAFSDDVRSHTLATLTDELRAECGVNFLSVVFFDSSKSAWKEQLASVMSSANSNS